MLKNGIVVGLSLAVAALASAPLRAQTALAEARDIRITELHGDVTLYTPDDPQGIPAEADVPLDQGDRLVTGDDSSAELAFDGGDSVVSINADSDFTVRDSQRSSTILSLSAGSLLAKIKKLIEGENLQVQAPAAVAAVRGTEFGVDVTVGAQTSVGVFDEGRVEVSGQSGPPQILQANQETSIVKGAPAQPPRGLRRFLARRAFMRRVIRARVMFLARRWRRMSPAQRRAMRLKAFVRMRRNIRRARRRGAAPGVRERRQKFLEQMKKRREERREDR